MRVTVSSSLPRRAFTRWEALVICLVTGVVALLMARVTARLRELRSGSECAATLRALHLAFVQYQAQFDGRFPVGYIRRSNEANQSWDAFLEPYIRANLSEEPATVDAYMSAPQTALLCPSDRLPVADWAARYKRLRRSYSMIEHTMTADNWPPNYDNATGMGLWWDYGGDGLTPRGAAADPRRQPDRATAFRTDMIIAPERTILVTEQIRRENVLGHSQGALVSRTADHVDDEALDPDRYHNGRINYLMVDGSVEALEPDATVGVSGQAGDDPKRHLGMWTVDVND